MGETNPISGAVRRPLYYVIPEAVPEMVDIDGDGVPDISHKKIGIIYFLDQCPAGKETTRIEDKPDVAMSISGVKIPITDIQKTGVSIDNAHKAQLATIFAGRSHANNNSEIEKLHKLNIPIFISAGNRDKIDVVKYQSLLPEDREKTNRVNYESFLPGTISVGALEPNSKTGKLEPAIYSSNTPLITEWAQGTYPVRIIRDSQGNIKGYNITNGNKVQIPVEETSRKGKISRIQLRNIGSETIETIAGVYMDGTSWAASVKPGMFLKQKPDVACDLPADKK